MFNTNALLLSAITLGALMFATTAPAADLPRRPYLKAPAQPFVSPATSWNGFYVGGHLGYGDIEDTGVFAISRGGLIGGGQVGYNYQFMPSWVIGFEGDLTAFTHTGTTALPFAAVSDPNFAALATGRLGYATSNILLYVKGGAAWLDSDYRFGIPQVSVSDTRFGYTVGGGLEYGFSPSWSGKVEYNYLDFGTDSYFASGIKTEAHLFKLGVNYHLSGFGGLNPLFAKY